MTFNPLVITERGPEESWLLNLGLYNHETDVEITRAIGVEILRLQSMDFGQIYCTSCLNQDWVCEEHPTLPWSGVVGNILGCEPDCGGPGVLCQEDHAALQAAHIERRRLIDQKANRLMEGMNNESE